MLTGPQYSIQCTWLAMCPMDMGKNSGLLSHWLQVRILSRSLNKYPEAEKPYKAALFFPTRPADW
jgi:hypothetical protein